MAEIDYYLFPLSPFSYLAGLRLEETAARHGATVRYKPVQLMRIFAAVGTPQVKDRHESKQRYRLADIARVVRMNGMPVNLAPRHWPTNPVPASAAIITAQEAGGGDVGRLVHAFLRAVWAEDRDIAEDSGGARRRHRARVRGGPRRPRHARRGGDALAQHRLGAGAGRLRCASLPRRRGGLLGAGTACRRARAAGRGR